MEYFLIHTPFNDGGGLDIVPDIGEGDITSPGDIARSGVVSIV